MKVLLINPHKLMPDAVSITLKPSPPLGLAYIASSLESTGAEVQVYDCIAEAPNNYFPYGKDKGISVLGIDYDEMLSALDHHYDLIGISIMFSNNWLANRNLINLLKEKYPKATIIAGGEHVTAIPEFCLETCLGLDVVIMGEGEETIYEFALNLKDGKSYAETSGIAFREEGGVKVLPRRKRIRQLDEILHPAWHLFPLQKYFENNLSFGVAEGRSLPIFATRGCPYECTFCSSPQMWGKKYSMRSVDEVIAEIKGLQEKYHVNNIDFYDLTAIIRKQWILEFCQKLEEENIKITWQIPAGTRSEAIDMEVSQALFKAGCKNITYAPESGSERMLKAIKKKVNIDNILKSINSSHKAGLNVKLNIILGYPDEKVSDIFKTIWMLIRTSYAGATDASPTIFSPYPGSELFRELLENKELELNDAYFERIVNSNSLHNFINYNRNHTKATMLFMLFLSYLAFYTSNYLFRPQRFFRLIKNLINKSYETRGEWMLAEIFNRKKNVKKTKKMATELTT